MAGGAAPVAGDAVLSAAEEEPAVRVAVAAALDIELALLARGAVVVAAAEPAGPFEPAASFSSSFRCYELAVEAFASASLRRCTLRMI